MTAKADFEVRLPEKDLQKLITMMKATAKAAGMAQEDVDDLMDEIQTGSKKGSDGINKLNKQFDGFGGTAKKVGGLLAAAFAADRLLDYQKQIIDITSQYEKMEAVLTTALGSNSAAQVAMAQIENFAKKTPFQVNQLTDSYIKLVNRGLQPSNKELTALGDFSASAGKDIDQLVEAILDVNNTERWTELGLKVKTEGDKIQATFKGITVEADRTEKGAMDMVKAFGEMEGIAGSMAGISDTLGGKISNLEDAMDRLFKTIGSAESGPMQVMTTWLTTLVNATSDLLEDDFQQINRDVAELFDTMREGLDDLKTEDDIVKKIEAMKAANELLATSFSDLAEKELVYEAAIDRQNKKLFRNQGTIDEYEATLADLSKQMDDNKVAFKANALAVEYLERALKKLTGASPELSWDDYIISTEGAELKTLELALEMEGIMKGAYEAMQKSGGDWIKEMESFLDEGVAEIEKADEDIIAANDKVVDEYKEGVEKMKRSLQELKDWMREKFWMEAAEYAVEYYNNIVAMQNNASEKQINALEMQRDYELKMAGDNKTAQAEINEEYDKKVAALQAKQARREQRAALFAIAVNTAVSAVKLFPETIPPGILSALAIGLGATQAGVVLSEPIPAFFKGVVGFKGKGSDTSDDNLVKISNNESIMTALSTRKFARYYEAMNDPGFTEKDLRRMVLKQLPEGVSMSPAPGADHSALRSEMKQMTREIVGAVKSKSGVNITLDGHTYSAEMIDGLNKKKYLSKKFGFKL